MSWIRINLRQRRTHWSLVCVFCKPKEEHLYSAVVVEADMDAPLEEEEDTTPIVIPTKKSFSNDGMDWLTLEIRTRNCL